MSDVRPQAWVPWIDFPQYLSSGKMAGQWWVDFKAGAPPLVVSQVTIDAGVFDFDAAAASHARAGRVSLDARGRWPAFKATFEAAGTPQQRPVPVDPDDEVQWQLQVEDLELQLPDMFMQPLLFDKVALDLATKADAQHRFSVLFSRAHIVSPALDLVAKGHWRQTDPHTSGVIDMQGVLSRARLSQIGPHLPITVDPDAREWLSRGLPEGELRDARVVLSGELDHFPFGESPDKGLFRIAGRFDNTRIDYAPPVAPGESTWPALTAARGVVALDKVDLRLFADEAIVTPEPGRPITLTRVKARIPDIENNAILTVQGDSEGQAEAYLGLARTSPLGGLLDNALAQSSAEGRWSVPLRLRVPLMDTDATTVQGEIHFDGGAVVIDPDVPPLSSVRGHLSFSDTGLDSQTLTATFLGGPLSLKGGIGGDRKGLGLQGRLEAEALAEFVDLKGMRRLSGALGYQGTIQRLPTRRYTMAFQSDLKGLGADFPAPAGKAADQALPLRVDWTPGTDAHSARLEVSLGNDARVRLQRRPAKDSQAWFDAVGVGIRQAPLVPARGVSVEARYPFIDADLWQTIVDEFDEPLNKTASVPRPAQRSGQARLPLLPSLRQLRVQADRLVVHGLDLEQATLSLSQSVPGQWRADINSIQTAGVLRWNEARAGQSGSIEARFERLALGASDDTEADEVSPTTPESAADRAARFEGFDIPALNLEARQFTLYGRPMGELSVRGINTAKGQVWTLESLTMRNEAAHLSGSGVWRLDGDNRGLTLDAKVEVADLGRLLDRMGHKGAVSGGSGSIAGKVVWGNMPWQFERSDISGALEVDLRKGRFSSVNSRSAKVLELLSFQSMQRILTFDLSPEGMFREGYPFDALGGSLRIERGVMSTNNFTIEGPVGLISLGGDVNLVNETLGLQAMVAPNLDMSGAALASLVINPIVGVGAFLTQWLLKAPLSRAMTLHYQVSGKLDDPKLKEVSAPEKTDGQKDTPSSVSSAGQ